MKNILTVVRAVIIRPDEDGAKILLCQNPAHKKYDAGKWVFPGGKIDSGENELEALAREVSGEVGINFVPKDILMQTVNSSPADPRFSSIQTIYLIGNGEENAIYANEPHDDKPNAKLWLPPQKITALPLTDSASRVVDGIIKIKPHDLLKL